MQVQRDPHLSLPKRCPTKGVHLSVALKDRVSSRSDSRYSGVSRKGEIGGHRRFEVSPEALSKRCDPDRLGSLTSEGIPPQEGMIGQSKALELGLGLDQVWLQGVHRRPAPGFYLPDLIAGTDINLFGVQ